MIGVIDRFLAALGLLVASPVLAVAALGIRLSSPGSVLYRARRAGVRGEPFTMYKLRTMHVDQELAGRITSRRDPRIFPLGGRLRRAKVDELPQLVNVLRGEMSLIGPRPEDISIVRDHYDAMMRESLTVPPGISGPGSLDYFATEHGLPSDPADAELHYLEHVLPRKIALDLVYVRNRTLGYHMMLIVRTALGVLGLQDLFAPSMRREMLAAEAILAERSRR